MIFVNNLKSVFNQEWTSTDKYPGLRWKLLIDKDLKTHLCHLIYIIIRITIHINTETISKNVTSVMSNSFGFGGTNASLILSKN